MGKMFQWRDYTTGVFGKWHLGSHREAPFVEDYGFDVNKTFVSRNFTWHVIQTPDFNQRIDSLINDEALQFISEPRDNPFLAVVCYSTPHAPLNPTQEQMQPYSGYGTDRYPHANAVEIYGGAITELDRLVGEILGAVPSNTLVIFTSDNGPVGKPSPKDEVPNVAAHHGIGSAGPFRGGKDTVYEGGIRVPFIAHWPGVVPPGTSNSTQLATIDLLPSLLSLADLSYPNVSWDGQDMAEAFRGQFVEREQSLFFEYRYGYSSPVMAVVDGNFKLLANRDGSRKELYDLSTPLGEREIDQFDSEAIREDLFQRLLNWRNSLPDSPVDPGAGKLEWNFPDYSSP